MLNLLRFRAIADYASHPQLAFASNPDSMAGIGHRLAALEDSRLLPIIQDAGSEPK
jgi:hypothetical protein